MNNRHTHPVLLTSALSALAFNLLGCATTVDSDEVLEHAIEHQDELGGATWQPNPEHVGVVAITSTFSKGSGAVWKSWSTPLIYGSYIITARHVLTQADELSPGSVTVKMGLQTATALYVRRYPLPDIDIAIIRVNKALSVNGSVNLIRALYRGDYNSLPQATLSCYGYGETAAGAGNLGTLRWAWFYASGYSPVNHVLTVSSWAGPTYFATIQSGDSGGPCFDVASNIAGTVSLGVQSGGGNTISMDPAVQTWLASNQF